MGNSIFSLFNNQQNDDPVQQGPDFTALSFQYQPNTLPNYQILNQAPNGISIILSRSNLTLESVNNWQPLAFELPTEIDETWQGLIQQYVPNLANNEEFVRSTQGFMQYCHRLLEQLYRTDCGRTVIDFLMNDAQKKVYIVPTIAPSGNCVRGASSNNAYRRMVMNLMRPNARFTEQDGLVEMARNRFGGDDDVALQRMADFIKDQPLYSLCKTPDYEFSDTGFLSGYFYDTGFTLKGADLRNWFTGGADSQFALHLQNNVNENYDNVSFHTYTRLMAIVALEPVLQPGEGSSTTVCLLSRASAADQHRPAAIGLGHELIHAYWAARGEQLGYDSSSPATMLFEMKCVGLGPWQHTSDNPNPISENRLRAQWQAANGVAVAQRTVYESNVEDNRAARSEFRNESRTV